MRHGPCCEGTMRRDVVVIGGSAGAVETLRTVVARLPADFSAAVLIVVHAGPRSPALLPEILGRAGPLPARFADTGVAIQPGQILVAPADHHMLATRGGVVLTRGARENFQRPAVDPLFRSAAVTFGSRVVGVILSGNLDDGTAGLSAVQRCGGLTVVQDERDAAYPSMPASARANVPVDHAAPAAEIASLLVRATTEAIPDAEPTNQTTIEAEAAMDVGQLDDADLLDRLGERTLLSCPECQGALWELQDDVLRFRCHVGHAYNPVTLDALKTRELEDALWAAVRGFGETAHVADKIARRHSGEDAVRFAERARTARAQADLLRQVIGALPVFAG
jgi:two-component system, chemotaxis family, protein-glutamate methylesterase/glutaminase